MPPESTDPTEAIYRNLSVAELVEDALRRGEGSLADSGALAVNTGKYTGRSPRDKFIVDDETTHGLVDWGAVNQPFDREAFDQLHARVDKYMAALPRRYVFDGYAGASPRHRLSIRVISEYAWHSLFAHQLLLRTDPAGERPQNEPDFTVIDAANFAADPKRDKTKSETFIIVDFSRNIVLIGGTQYAGEIKKSVFSILNYLLPQQGVLAMHCSANVGAGGRTALFFGLSGTGKTTLSADPSRGLIGDDEHGWSDDGIFNFEGGCYAKCIGLTKRKERQIWSAVRFGTVLENVVLDPSTRAANYDDTSLTENTRVAYPLRNIPHAIVPSVGDHPDTVIFLTADAFGVLPPISRLTEEQAMYHFLSGYTSKLAGTERGVTSPEATFSACFAAPFLPLAPVRYAEMLGARLRGHKAACFLVNTGWTGGAYGIGERIDLDLTRRMVHAALDGSLTDAPASPDPLFGLLVPNECAGVPSRMLQSRSTWSDAKAYDTHARDLAGRFRMNFARFKDVPQSIIDAGPA